LANEDSAGGALAGQMVFLYNLFILPYRRDFSTQNSHPGHRLDLKTPTGKGPAYFLSSSNASSFSHRFAILMKGVSRSMGMGNRVVEFFSAAISLKVWR
jgi:hypothetical protein